MPKNIAMMTMSMDIGGAETHIYELSCALAKRGHNVTVFSAGGAYVKSLERNGVHHIITPLCSKSPAALASAYRTVRDYVKHNPDCIIHSHTRISNYTANAISKKFAVPFVSTVHGKFSTGFFQKLFTKWGTRALTVSSDLRQHTHENYNFPLDHLRVTVNGINLEAFSQSRNEEFKKELGYDENTKIILCVSRLNDTACNHVRDIINMASDIYESDSNIRILIVGDGNKYKELYKLGLSVNNKTCKGFIRFAGAQTDIHRYCNIADLFFGISRSALEAMACKVPVILYGNTGYIGVMTKDNQQDCIETNFTCRGFSYPNNKEVVRLILDILQNPGKYKEYTEQAFELVKKEYSVDRMADDALITYEQAEKETRCIDTMLCGYYGRRNLGDDILLKAITDNMKNVCKAERGILLTADPSNKPESIELAIHRFDIFKIRKYMKKTNLFILGGGSILQDATSSRSLYYYLYIAGLAKKFGCKLMLYSNGIGPIRKPSHRVHAVKLLEKADAITLRDSNSLEYLRKIGIANSKIQVTADEVFSIDTSFADKIKLLDDDKKYIGINLRGVDVSDEFLSKVAKSVTEFANSYGYIPVLLPMHLKQDLPALTKISRMLGCEHKLMDKPMSHYETLSVLKQCDITIVERLHAVVFSSIFAKPFVAVNYDPKVLSLCNELDMTEFIVDPKNTSSEEITRFVTTAVEKHDEISRRLITKSQQKRELAKLNAITAKSII